MVIKLLSETTRNRIAAGEVIERPASVVKELVENSLDAGATRIEVTLDRAGKNLIIISDNGFGMSKEDLELCVERHATSKLDEEDIMNIRHFGFRGEALPSIASISRLKITTRQENIDKAYSIFVEGGYKNKIEEESNLSRGTIVEIRDLFFATPARLKFLKNDQTELAACTDIVKKFALAHPSVAFIVNANGKQIFKTRSINPETANFYLIRAEEVLGRSFAENAVVLENKDSVLKIRGYISLPTYNKATQQEQYLFVNNRPVKDKILLNAVRVAYMDYLSRDRYPVVIIYLEMDTLKVDVNVHPAKTEVRFEDSNQIKSFLIHAIKYTLEQKVLYRSSSETATSLLGAFKSENIYTKEPGSESKAFQSDSPSVPRNFFSEAGNSKFRAFQPKSNVHANLQRTFVEDLEPLAKSYERQDIVSNEEAKKFPLGAACAHLHENYIIAQTDNSVVIVDQHAAHERLIYEDIKKSLQKNGLVKQRLLIPEIVDLNDSFYTQMLLEKSLDLSRLGLTIEKFSENAILVTEVPQLLGNINVKKLVEDLVDNLKDEIGTISLDALIESVTETYACHSAVRSGQHLDIMQANALLRKMESTALSGQCNHGRPTYIELKLKDIEKLFGRR